MNKRIISIVIIVCIPIYILGQQTRYLDEKGKETNQRQAVIKETIIVSPPNNYLIVKQMSNNDTVSSIQCSSLTPLIRNGVTKLYYENGSIHYLKHYSDNKLNGRIIRYYKNGRLMSIVDLGQDSVIFRTSYNSAGREIEYIVDLVQPKYMKKPIEFFRQYLAQNIQYPPSAVEAKESGKFKIEFNISETGSIDKIKLVGGDLKPELNNEVIRVIKSTAGKWIPAQEYGESTSYKYSMNFNFQL